MLVTDFPPVASIVATSPAPSSDGVVSAPAGTTITFSLSTLDISPTADAAGFLYVVNWGDGGAHTSIHDILPDQPLSVLARLLHRRHV